MGHGADAYVLMGRSPKYRCTKGQRLEIAGEIMTTQTVIFTPDQIAPCGMNCGVCSAFLSLSHGIPTARGKITHCAGCRTRNKTCAYLKGHCRKLASGRVSFCYECGQFPCKRLLHIDSRYQTRYGTSLIHNLEEIKQVGIGTFLRKQTDRYLCPKCRTDVVCVHNKKCFRCDGVTSWKLQVPPSRMRSVSPGE